MSTPMIPVNSSQISYIGFDDENNKLYVIFKNNKTFEYSDVPYTVWKELKSSDSIGSYFTKNIKTKYQYKEIK